MLPPVKTLANVPHTMRKLVSFKLSELAIATLDQRRGADTKTGFVERLILEGKLSAYDVPPTIRELVFASVTSRPGLPIYDIVQSVDAIPQSVYQAVYELERAGNLRKKGDKYYPPSAGRKKSARKT